MNNSKIYNKELCYYWFLKEQKKTPTNMPKKSDKRVNSIVNFAAFNNRGKCSIAKSKSI